MKPHVLDFIPVSLEDADKYIEDAGGYKVAAKQKGQVQIKLCNNNGDTLSLHCTTYFWQQIYVIGYFQILS